MSAVVSSWRTQIGDPRAKLHTNWKDIRNALNLNPKDYEAFYHDFTAALEATAGTVKRTAWPIQRAFINAKARRRSLPPGHVHSRDLFYFDVRRSRRKGGVYIMIKNRAPYARAVEAGAPPDRYNARREAGDHIRSLHKQFQRNTKDADALRRTLAKRAEVNVKKELLEAKRRTAGGGDG